MTISTIGKTTAPESRDHASFTDWIVNELEVGTKTDEQIGEGYNDSLFTTTASIDFVDANIDQGSNNTLMRAAAGESFNDHADKLTNALYPNQSNGVLIEKTSGSSSVITTNLAKLEIEGLQIVKASGYGGVLLNSNNGTTGDRIVRSCMMLAAATSNVFTASVRDFDFISSNLLFDGSNSGTCLTASYGTIVNVDGCNIVRTRGASTTRGLREIGSGSLDIHNSAIFGFTTLSTGNVTGDYNASDLAIGFGSNNQASKTYADQFEDITYNGTWESSTADFTPKTTGDLNGNGNSATLPTLDILEQTRSGDYIGARDIVSGGGPTGNPWNYYAQQAA